MRIGILPLAAGRAAGGPETYEVQFFRALARIDRDNEYFVYCPEPRAAEAIGVRQENVVYRLLRPGFRPFSISAVLPALLLKDGVDLLHATYASPPFPVKPMVFTSHGMVNFLHPEFFPAPVLWRLNALVKSALRRAALVLCVSNHVREQMHALLGLPLERLIVSYLGVGPEFAPAPPAETRAWLARHLGLDAPYLLYVGKFHRAKNLDRLLRAYARYRRRTPTDLKLVLVGKKSGPSPIGALVRELALTEAVVQLPYLPAATLARLYGAAELFLFPSLFESFGLPVVEAMACGTPVLTSNIACLPEITQGAALLVDPYSVEQLAEGIDRVCSSPAVRAAMAARGLERARAFSWDRCARTTLAAYGSLKRD